MAMAEPRAAQERPGRRERRAGQGPPGMPARQVTPARRGTAGTTGTSGSTGSAGTTGTGRDRWSDGKRGRDRSGRIERRQWRSRRLGRQREAAAAGTPARRRGGATDCAGHAVSFNANVAGNNDPAKAHVAVTVQHRHTERELTAHHRILGVRAELQVGRPTRTPCFSTAATTGTTTAYGLDFGATQNGTGTIDPFTNGSTDPQGDNKSSGLMAASISGPTSR